MRIDPAGNFSPVTQSGVVGRPSTSTNQATAAPVEGEVFAPTSELAQLLSAVRLSPEVRTEVIENVAARLAAGELDSPEAAAATARALLDDTATG